METNSSSSWDTCLGYLCQFGSDPRAQIENRILNEGQYGAMVPEASTTSKRITKPYLPPVSSYRHRKGKKLPKTEKRKNDLDKACVLRGQPVFQTRQQVFSHFGPGPADDTAGVNEEVRGAQTGDRCPLSGGAGGGQYVGSSSAWRSIRLFNGEIANHHHSSVLLLPGSGRHEH